MDAVVEELDKKLQKWEKHTADEVRRRVIELIESADHDVLDVSRSRAAEQEVLDLLDEPTAR